MGILLRQDSADRMGGCHPRDLHPAKRAWGTYVAVALGVTVVALVAALLTVLCQPAEGSTMARNSSEALERLEKALDVTNRSLDEARGRWDGCRKQLGALEGKALELERALANVTELQEENRALKAEVAQQQEQLGDLQSKWDKLQLQNQVLEKQLQDMRSQHSDGNRLQAVSLSLLALLLLFLLLPGMLLL